MPAEITSTSVVFFYSRSQDLGYTIHWKIVGFARFSFSKCETRELRKFLRILYTIKRIKMNHMAVKQYNQYWLCGTSLYDLAIYKRKK